MLFNASFSQLTRLILVVAILSTTCLYLYPVWLGCNFPSTDGHATTALKDTLSQQFFDDPGVSKPFLAPFRLLVLADPQLEGDSSLPDPEDALGHKLVSHWTRLTQGDEDINIRLVTEILQELFTVNIPNTFAELRKRLDLFGNDYYLAHIFRTLHWWTKPTHVTVLGDLIGSQWVDDDEFAWRGWRYWNRVFVGGHKVEDEYMEIHTSSEENFLQMDDPAWQNRIINIAGNHDIGYAGDISVKRMERFEKVFGKANWDVRFELSSNATQSSTGVRPSLHLIVLNSMLLDTPALNNDLQNEVYQYLNTIIGNRVHPVEERSSFTLLLTHVPLHKREGICTDAPFFDFFDDEEDCDGACKPSGLKEQNHLSAFASQPGMLEALFGMNGNEDAPMQGRGRPGLILNGHDHEGCDTYHYIPANMTMISSDETDELKTNWEATRWSQADPQSSHTGIREVTLRSMMGEYSGNAGLLSLWYDFEQEEWKYDIQMCRLGIQHFWWAIHVLDVVAICLLVFSFVKRPISNIMKQHFSKQKTIVKERKID